MQRLIAYNCSDTYDKLEVRKANKYSYTDNGISYYIRFIGRTGNQSRMIVESSADNPLTGNWVANTTRLVNATNALFYPAIPFEMLRTYETQPQVIV